MVKIENFVIFKVNFLKPEPKMAGTTQPEQQKLIQPGQKILP